MKGYTFVISSNAYLGALLSYSQIQQTPNFTSNTEAHYDKLAITQSLKNGVNLHLMNSSWTLLVEFDPRKEPLRRPLIHNKDDLRRNLRTQEDSFIE